MKFSIVIPSYLGSYASAARNREGKLIRAVTSVLSQTFTDFECLVIADGCSKTVELLWNIGDERLVIHKINRERLWSGKPRNTGIEKSKAEFITYLDIDDVFGENHLSIVNNELKTYDWVWFNDIRYHPRLKEWYENECDIHQIGRHGTSNICHKRTLDVDWSFSGYAHDYYFVQQLKKYHNFTKITTPEYYVCHVPGTHSSGGYDE